MKVLLLQNVKGIGRAGDIKNVADGYGRNFLIVKNLAKIATDGNIEEAEVLKKKAEAEDKLVLEKVKELVLRSKDINLEFTKKSSKSGKLFASVTKDEIAESFSKEAGVKINPDSVDLKEHGEHIKQEGTHVVEVELAPNVKAEIKVIVKGE